MDAVFSSFLHEENDHSTMRQMSSNDRKMSGCWPTAAFDEQALARAEQVVGSVPYCARVY